MPCICVNKYESSCRQQEREGITAFENYFLFSCMSNVDVSRVTLIFFTMFLLVHSRSAHFLVTFFEIGGPISKFVVVLQCIHNITSGGNDVREIGMNTMQNELWTRT